MPFSLVQKFDVATREDLQKHFIIDIDGHTLEPTKFGPRFRPNNLDIDQWGSNPAAVALGVD